MPHNLSSDGHWKMPKFRPKFFPFNYIEEKNIERNIFHTVSSVGTTTTTTTMSTAAQHHTEKQQIRIVLCGNGLIHSLLVSTQLSRSVYIERNKTKWFAVALCMVSQAATLLHTNTIASQQLTVYITLIHSRIRPSNQSYWIYTPFSVQSRSFSFALIASNAHSTHSAHTNTSSMRCLFFVFGRNQNQSQYKQRSVSYLVQLLMQIVLTQHAFGYVCVPSLSCISYPFEICVCLNEIVIVSDYFHSKCIPVDATFVLVYRIFRIAHRKIR